MSEIENTAVEAVTEPTESEEAIRARIRQEVIKEYESKTDRRVTEALKTLQKKADREKHIREKEALKKQIMSSQRDLAQAQAREREIRMRENRLIVVDLVSLADLPAGFRALIPTDDLVEIEDEGTRYRILKDRIIDIKREFYQLVGKAVEAERAKYMK